MEGRAGLGLHGTGGGHPEWRAGPPDFHPLPLDRFPPWSIRNKSGNRFPRSLFTCPRPVSKSAMTPSRPAAWHRVQALPDTARSHATASRRQPLSAASAEHPAPFESPFPPPSATSAANFSRTPPAPGPGDGVPGTPSILPKFPTIWHDFCQAMTIK
ncbi:MAG: hypothetical protein JWL81_2569 [Verrucomicrobiales bacterium]|nr:hypothetical protein [Verrucomicrobiales bacterium]